MTHIPSPTGWTGDTAALTIDQIKDMALGLARELPAMAQVELIRSLNENLSFSYGSDRIEKGCDMVEDDLRTEEQQATDPWHFPRLPTITTRAVPLNPDAWMA